MKKVTLITMLILVMLVFASCTTKNVASNYKPVKVKSSLASPNIKYEYFYRGFATMKQNTASKYPKGVLVIETYEDWHNFMNTYVPGILYNVSIDFSKESLIYDGQFSTNSFYATETKINDLNIKNNKIEEEIYFVNNGIYAQNINDITHCFVNIVKVNKSDIPKNIVNIYHKGTSKKFITK